MRRRSYTIMAAVMAGLALGAPSPEAAAKPSDPGVVNYAVLPKGSVGNIVGAPMRFESTFTDPFQAFYVDNPACNNWADIGLPEVYADPDLASFNGAVTQTSPTDARQRASVVAPNAAIRRVPQGRQWQGIWGPTGGGALATDAHE